ncbi:MAG: hypothetical protein WCJ60_04455 [bacterium]
MNIIDKCFKDKKGKIVLGQAPNLPLIFWGISRLSILFINSTNVSLIDLIDKISFASILIWAGLELYSGVNLFRRAVGLTILIFTIQGRL